MRGEEFGSEEGERSQFWTSPKKPAIGVSTRRTHRTVNTATTGRELEHTARIWTKKRSDVDVEETHRRHHITRDVRRMFGPTDPRLVKVTQMQNTRLVTLYLETVLE